MYVAKGFFRAAAASAVVLAGTADSGAVGRGGELRRGRRRLGGRSVRAEL